jgi:hypothetical protein
MSSMSSPTRARRNYLFEDPPPEVRFWFKWTVGLLILSALCPDHFKSHSNPLPSVSFVGPMFKLATAFTFLFAFKKLIDHKGLSRGLMILAPLTLLGLIILMLMPPKVRDSSNSDNSFN